MNIINQKSEFDQSKNDNLSNQDYSNVFDNCMINNQNERVEHENASNSNPIFLINEMNKENDTQYANTLNEMNEFMKDIYLNNINK